MRVSSAYRTAKGLLPSSSSAAHPADGECSRRPASQASGRLSRPNSCDSARTATSEVPNRSVQPCSSR